MAGGGTGQLLSGLVEIFHDGFWSGVCDSGWSGKEARVVCRQLGLQGQHQCTASSRVTISDPIHSYITGGTPLSNTLITSTIGWLSNVDCNGSEIALKDCELGEWKLNENCSNEGVVCEGTKVYCITCLCCNNFYCYTSQENKDFIHFLVRLCKNNIGV